MIALLRTKTQLRQWSMRYDVNNFDRPMDQCRNFPVFDTIKQKLEFANQCRESYIKLQLEYGKLNIRHSGFQDSGHASRADQAVKEMESLIGLINLEWYQYQDSIVEVARAFTG
jgi:hypothetical protein